MNINEMISTTWALFVFWLLICVFYYMRWVLAGSSFTYDPSIVFYHKYLLDKKSILNKLYFTKKSTYTSPRIKQTSFMFGLFLCILVILLIFTVISTIINNETVTLFVYYFNIVLVSLGFISFLISIFVIRYQARKCMKKQLLFQDSELSELLKEIKERHPDF
ncbi:MAG: hypothetical protein CVV61_05840 [Tenericutes bacterium HGW-Tenericutes-6]|nr:MAG: hypothetical protein CVV61_05840 [Tenericutes bacterium HGW-Tenericutes-6]